MGEARRTPLDFDMLGPGVVIPPEDLRRVIGDTDTPTEYRWRLLHLKQRIIDELAERGIDVEVRERRGSLEILGGLAAQIYNNSQGFQGYRRMCYRAKRMTLVDPSEMTDTQRRNLEHAQLRLSRMAQAAAKAMREQNKIERLRRPPEITD